VASSVPDLSIGNHTGNPILAITTAAGKYVLFVGLLQVILQSLKILFVI
jgi:hypothetical protein